MDMGKTFLLILGPIYAANYLLLGEKTLAANFLCNDGCSLTVDEYSY
jgi:hypothetical protein